MKTVRWNAAVSSGPIEILNEISTFLVRETNSLWRTSSSRRRRYSSWPRFVTAKILAGRHSRSRSRLCHLSEQQAIFGGFSRAPGFYLALVSFARSNETHASVVSTTRAKSIFTLTIKSVPSRLQKSPQKRIRERDIRAGIKTTEGRRRGGNISVCTLHYSPKCSLKWWRRHHFRKKIDSGKGTSLFLG